MKRVFPILTCLALAAIIMPTHSAVAANWQKELKTDLEAVYEVSKLGIGDQRIVSPGTVLVVQEEGIAGSPADEAMPHQTHVEDGEIRQARGFLASLKTSERTRFFKPGEEVLVYRISVVKRGVGFFITSRDTFPITIDGDTKHTRYQGNVYFLFPKEEMPEISAKQVQEAVNGVLSSKAEMEAAEPATIAFGQSPEKVRSILGKPDKVVQAGPKLIYIYPDLKITFMNEEVTDVE